MKFIPNNKSEYKIRKACCCIMSVSVCAVFLSSAVMCALAAPESTEVGLPFAVVLGDRRGTSAESAPSRLGEEQLDEMWRSIAQPQDFSLYLGENALKTENAMIDDEMYVSLSGAVAAFLPDAEISESAGSVSASADGFSLSAEADDWWLIANGRYLKCDMKTSREGSLMVPLSVVSRIFSSSLTVEDDRSKAVFSQSQSCITSADDYYGERLYWLSRIISAESRGEDLYGKIAVGNVVMNRVATPGFPGTVYDVIFDTSCGVQFTPAADGSVFNNPDEESVIAAKLCLEGVSVSDTILYFMNPATASNSWIKENRTFVTAIGNHEFYS